MPICLPPAHEPYTPTSASVSTLIKVALPQILACKAEVSDIRPFIAAFKDLVRRRPFLVQRLEEVLKKLLTSLEFFDDDGRRKIAIGALSNPRRHEHSTAAQASTYTMLSGVHGTRDALVRPKPSRAPAVTALVFSEKLGVLPDRIFESMFNDRLVAKGTILAVITDIFKYYIELSNGSVEELCVLLAKAKVADRLLDYFPPGQQTEDAFKAHFEKEGMAKLVRYPACPVPRPLTQDFAAPVLTICLLLKSLSSVSAGHAAPRASVGAVRAAMQRAIVLLSQSSPSLGRASRRMSGPPGRNDRCTVCKVLVAVVTAPIRHRFASVSNVDVACLQVEWQSKKLRDNNTVLLQATLSQLFGEEAGTEAYMECVREYTDTVPGAPHRVVRA